ncbi:glycosyltransferase [Massilia sp. FT127W]|uniref:Glycosyltransferase n=2 Tax=Pseudoduganella aquatica TaxID=2660641 RepID=A0A7X4HF57_9BURK|nr:glycosyltransferase [Pseudoduganella aquatica]
MDAFMVNKRVLMIAYHYPPMRGSSGIQRTLKFSQYLPQSGWGPVMLSAHPRAYSNPGDDQMADIPASVPVTRAFALDTARHLSVGGRYAGFMALPDRWASWCLGAIPAGWRLIRRHRPAVIWSTYPIASAHLIGLVLRRLTGLPWVADLRDPMTDVSYPEDPRTRRVFQWIERKTIEHCTVAVCTTPGAIKTYEARFPAIPRERYRLIENAYDEENFADAERGGAAAAPGAHGGPLTLVHSGIIYPSERDPVPLFQALAALKRQGAVSAASVRVVLRATAHDDYLGGLIAEHGIADLVQLAPHVPYRDALAEMLNADGLLILQASNCNHQVPAKLYEYLRARRPILALTDSDGDTAATLRQAGIDSIAPLDQKDAIIAMLPRFLEQVRSGTAPLASAAVIAAHSRRARTEQLALLLDQVSASHAQ